MFRKRANKRRDGHIFSKTAGMVHKKNLGASAMAMRGGHRI